MILYPKLWLKKLKTISSDLFASKNKNIDATYMFKIKGTLCAIIYERSFPMNFRPYQQLPVTFQTLKGEEFKNVKVPLRNEGDDILNSMDAEDIDQIVLLGDLINKDDPENLKYYVYDILEINGNIQTDFEESLRLMEKFFSKTIHIKLPPISRGGLEEFNKMYELGKKESEIDGILVKNENETFLVTYPNKQNIVERFKDKIKGKGLFI
jgi:hypothetical protein